MRGRIIADAPVREIIEKPAANIGKMSVTRDAITVATPVVASIAVITETAALIRRATVIIIAMVAATRSDIKI